MGWPDLRTARLPPSALPGISPSRGEIGQTDAARWRPKVASVNGTGRVQSIQNPQTVTFDWDGVRVAYQSPPSRGRCPAGQRGASHAWCLPGARLVSGRIGGPR
ncbi:unnamed protein product [Ciceribacter sp. T2.26MG-112.2]|nr:unnamed protein product [Ciceribacter naphthalenivorans]